MSKTLGNVVDPLDVIHKYGTDALRFTLATGKLDPPGLFTVLLWALAWQMDMCPARRSLQIVKDMRVQYVYQTFGFARSISVVEFREMTRGAIS